MKYSFEPIIAKYYGVDGAIVIENLYFWIMKNKANDKNYFDGEYWTYNSVKAFEELFPFWSKRQIERILKNLENEGAIKTGNYNKLQYDRTKWYALNQTVLSIYANGEMEKTEWGNGNNQTGKPIPYNKPVDKPVDKPYKEKKEKKQTSLDEIINTYTSNLDLKETLQDFLKMRKAQKKVMTDRALKTLLNKLDTLATTDEEKIERLEESICNCWLTVYPKKDFNNKNYKQESLDTKANKNYENLKKIMKEQQEHYEENVAKYMADCEEVPF